MPRSLLLAAFAFLKHATGGAVPAADSSVPGLQRPRGVLVWIHADTHADRIALLETAERLYATDRLGAVLLTGPSGNEPLPEGVMAADFPGENRSAVMRFVAHWRPDLLVLTGTPLRPVLMSVLDRCNTPALLVAGRIERASYKRWRWMAPVARRMLSRFGVLLAEDWRTARSIRRLGVAETRVELGGGLEAASPPLGCTEAEREVMSKLLRNRPVWLVAGAIIPELPHVIAAHQQASRLAHRLLLVLAPASQQDVAGIATALQEAGLDVGIRSQNDDPEDDVQAFIADDDGEMGLWYRLAPMTFLGGTLLGQGPVRDPFEPAALGSAVMHGPVAGDWHRRFSRLAEGRAARSVGSPQDLAEAVCDLIAPDRAALLAHHGWQVVSGGAELSDRLVAMTLERVPLPKDAAE